jgi:hypothetical protein
MTVSPATTPGQILTSAYLNNNINSGLTYIKTQALTSSATNITSCFSATYSAYRIIFTDLVPSTGLQIQAQMLLASTPLTTNTYESQRLAVQGATVTGVGTNGTPVGFGNVGFLTTMASRGGQGAVMEIFNPFESTVYTSWSAQSTANNNAYLEINSATVLNTTSYDGIRILTSTGTLTGNAVVYGYRKA